MSTKNNFVDINGNDIENNLCVETDSHGLMCPEDKVKLNGIETGANKYVHPSYTAKSSGLYKVTVDGSGHVSATAAVTKADITGLGIPGQDTNTTYSNATTSAAGLMSASDKSKLDGIATGANKTVVDSSLSTSSTNPVQNSVVTTELNSKLATSNVASNVSTQNSTLIPNNSAIISYVADRLSVKMDKADPTGTGSLSINRKAGTTVGNYSTAIGYNCEAGNYSTAIGMNCTAVSDNTYNYPSIAIGRDCTTTNTHSVAMGDNCKAGYKSAVIGIDSQSTDDNNFLFGNGLSGSNTNNCIILGKYNYDGTSSNASTTTLRFILGDGSTDEARANLIEVHNMGSVGSPKCAIFVNNSALETAYNTLTSIDI